MRARDRPPLRLATVTLNGTLDRVLLVPNRAVAIDRERGTFTVKRIIAGAEGETTEPVTVEVGLRDGQFSEILSGLEAGDELLIGNDIPRIEFGPPDEDA